MILLPLFSLFGFVLIARHEATTWRESLVTGAVIWGAVLFILTETTSKLQLLTPIGVASAWIAVAICILYRLWQQRAKRNFVLGLRVKLPSELARVQIVVIVALAAGTLATALVSPPMGEDAFSYHLARVAHWIQAEATAPYPTHIQRQLFSGPGAEFLVLHFQLLAGSDRFATSVEWLGFAGCIVVVSEIARQLGAKAKGQIFASFFVATLPSAIAQASGAFVELYLAFWVCCFVSIGLRLVEQDRIANVFRYSLLLGASLGLAMLTKATAYLFAAPFLLWFGIDFVTRHRRQALQIVAVTAFAALLLNAEYLYNNQLVFGNPFSPPDAGGLTNTLHSPGAVLSNLSRNAALQFGTHAGFVNRGLYEMVQRFHDVIGVDLNDPRTTFGAERFLPVGAYRVEAMAGNPFHVLAFFGAALALGFVRLTGRSQARYFAICVSSAFLLFCVYLKWNPWNARLVSPLLVLSGALVGYVIDSIASSKVAFACVLFISVAAAPILLLNSERPLIGHRTVYSVPREQRYFLNDSADYASFDQASSFVAKSGCNHVGLIVEESDFEYPFWTFLKDRAKHEVMLSEYGVANLTARLPLPRNQPRGIPCAIVYMNRFAAPKTSVPIPSNFFQAWQQDSLRVFLPRPGATGTSTRVN